MDEYLTVKEVADKLRIHAHTVRRLCDEGEIKGVIKLEAGYRIPVSGLDAYLKGKEAGCKSEELPQS